MDQTLCNYLLIPSFLNLCIVLIVFKGIAVCHELVACVGTQSLQTISPTTAAEKLAEYLQLDKSSMKDPPADVAKKCRSFCVEMKKIGRLDIVKQLKTTLPSGITGWYTLRARE
jgi:hypothetical protein